ncbi:MAG TPA: transposase [Phenylobacterium sp.]|jgi:transposase-like protein
MSQLPPRSFSRDFRLAIAARIEAGEPIRALSEELGVHRQLLYKWRDAARRGDPPKARGRPPNAAAPALPEAAQARIAELERKIGQQQLEIDFFKGALRHIEASRQANDAPGVTASSRRSRR